MLRENSRSHDLIRLMLRERLLLVQQLQMSLGEAELFRVRFQHVFT
jgi:hypothetical protein